MKNALRHYIKTAETKTIKTIITEYEAYSVNGVTTEGLLFEVTQDMFGKTDTVAVMFVALEAFREQAFRQCVIPAYM